MDIRGNAGGPQLSAASVRTTTSALARSVAGAVLPSVCDPAYWFFYGLSYLAGGAGPRIFFGDLLTPAVEVAYSLQQDGAGLHGLVYSGLKVSTGRWVDRWGFGPLLLGTYTLQVPANGPGQFYGQLGPTNSGFESMQGSLANVTVWGGPLNVGQFEWVRQNRAALGRPLRPVAGFPPLLANWPLFDDLRDHSGGHHLEAVGGGRAPQPLLPERVGPEELVLAELAPQEYRRRRQGYLDVSP